MASRGIHSQLHARSRRGLTLAWSALFAVSALLQSSALAAPARASDALPASQADANLGAAVCGVVPLDIEIIIDTSGSMTSNSSGSPAHTRLYWAQQAAIQLVNDLQANGGISATGHRVGVTTFSGTTSTSLGGWSSTAAQLATLINGISSTGNTPLKTGMAQGAADLNANARNAVGGAVNREIIILSDGRPNPDQGPNGAVATTTTGQRPTQAQVDAFQNSADEVWSIAIGQGGSGSNQVDLALMQLLAKPASGHYFNVVDASQLSALFTKIFKDIICPAHVTVSKAVDAQSAAPGDTLHYTITLANDGGAAATGVTVHDPIAGLLAHGAFGTCDNGCSHDASSVDWSGLTVAAGGSLALHFSIVLDSSSWTAGTTVLGNTVVVSGTNCDEQSVDSTCSTSTTVTTSSTVGIAKDVSPTSLLGGASAAVTYTLVVSNTGDGSTAGHVVVTDNDFPAFYSISSVVCTPTNATCDAAHLMGAGIDLGSLAAASSVTITVSGTAAPDNAADLGDHTNTANACMQVVEQQAVCTDDQATVSVGLTRNPGIHVVKSASVASLAYPGGNVTYTYEVTNTGNVALSGVDVADDKCDSPAFVGGDANSNAMLDLAETWTFTCTSSISVTTTNVATATGHDGERTVQATDTKTVSVGSALDVVKSFTGNSGGSAVNGMGIANVGDSLTYMLSYQVNGAAVTDAVITDVLPNGLSYVNGSATNSDEFSFVGYDNATRTLRWTASTATKDGSVTYRAQVQAGSNSLPQPLENVATIDSDQTAPVSDTADVLVQLVEAATDRPVITLPPTDTLNSGDQAPSDPGSGPMLTLFALIGIGLIVGSLGPTRGRLRRERVRRR